MQAVPSLDREGRYASYRRELDVSFQVGLLPEFVKDTDALRAGFDLRDTDIPRAGFERRQNLSFYFAEW